VWPSRDGAHEAPAPWLPLAWAVVWVGGAAFQALPDQKGGKSLVVVILLVAAEYLVGVGALARRTRMPAVTLGLALALTFWVVGQDFGNIDSGQATDPNSGPVLALMAIALLAGRNTPTRPAPAAPRPLGTARAGEAHPRPAR
jgi:hypothetical protein